MKFTQLKMSDNGQGKWTVTIDGEEFKDAIKKAKNKVLSELEVPGFRKGKVPTKTAEKYVTNSSVYNRAFKLLLEPAFNFAKEQKDALKPFSSPNPVLSDISSDLMVIDFVFDLYPSIEIGEYKNLKVEKPKLEEVSEAELESNILSLQEKFVMEKIKDSDAKIAKNDNVKFDFTGYINNEPFQGGEAKDFQLVIGSNQFIPGFEDSMIGLGLGEHSIKVTFPKDYVPEFANKDAEFKLNITEIKERVLPSRDDELAKDLDLPNIDTYEKLVEYTKKNIQDYKLKNLKEEFIGNVLDEISKNSKIELPKNILDKEISRLRKEFEEEIQKNNLTLEKYKEVSKFTDEDIYNELKNDAKSRISNALIVEEILKKEKFEVSKESIEEKYKNISSQYNIDVEQVKNFITEDKISEDIKTEMLNDFLFENNGN